MKALLEEPVKEAVREALDEERSSAENRADDADGTDEADQPEDSDETENGNRILRPAVLLPILGLVALVAVAKRRRLMEAVEESGVADQGDETDSTDGSNQQTMADVEERDTEESTDTKYSTSPDAYDGDTDREGSIENGNYNVDTDDEELSTTE